MHTHTYSYRTATANEGIYLPVVSGASWAYQWFEGVYTLAALANKTTGQEEAYLHHRHSYDLWVVTSWCTERNTDLGILYGLEGAYVPAYTSDAIWDDGTTHHHAYRWHYAGQATWDGTNGSSGPPYSSTNEVPFEFLSGSWLTHYTDETSTLATQAPADEEITNQPDVTGDVTVVVDRPVLELVRNIEMQVGGRFYVSKSGYAVYESRYHRSG